MKNVLIVFAILASFWGIGMDSNKKYDCSKKPSKEELKKMLSPEQYKVTQEDGTEAPFQNPFWDKKEPGIYVDVVTGEPLFSSLDKFDSGTGWPSFTKPLDQQNVKTKEDTKHGMKRVEVRSKSGDSHLGHVFEDGPKEAGGLRYCINSASLRFIPAARLKEEGYEKYAALFEKKAPTSKEAVPMSKEKQTATFAGGCFWGMEEILRKIPGVLETVVGYTGGFVENATYDKVKKGDTGHAESVQVTFDPRKISYEELLGWFFRMHDPTTKNRQGNDRGTQYRSAIFYHSDEQKKIAEKVIERVNKSGKWRDPIVTEVMPASQFYKAEDYHQDYLKKNPGGYTCHYLRD